MFWENMKIHFYLINNNKKDEKYIYIYLRRNGKTSVVPNKLYLKPIYWDVKKQRAKAQYPLSLNFNKALDTINTTLTDTYLKLISNNPLVSDEILFEKMKTSLKPKNENFWLAYDEFIKVKQNTLSRKYLEKFTTLKSKLKKFQDEYHYVVSFDSINPLFLDKFLGYLIKRRNSNNTIATDMKNLKTFLKWAIKREYCEPKDYSFLRHRKEEADTFALSKDELRKIYNLNLSDRVEMAKSRDAFLVACLTALRFEDVRNLDIRNILGGEVSSEVTTVERKQLRVRQHKTKNFAEIVQYPE